MSNPNPAINDNSGYHDSPPLTRQEIMDLPVGVPVTPPEPKPSAALEATAQALNDRVAAYRRGGA